MATATIRHLTARDTRIRGRLLHRAALYRREPHRLLARRIHEFFRARENENLDGGEVSLDAHLRSTATGQLVDTTVLILITFGGQAAGRTMLKSDSLRLCREGALRNPGYEGVEVFDRESSFNPFARTATARATP